MNTKEKDLQYIMHTYGRYDVALKSGKGVVAYDEDGKRYLDVSSGIGVNSLGYCDDGWLQAITAQAGTIQHMSNYFYSKQASDLAETLCKLTGLAKVCFGNSGAEANECAIKIARKYSFDRYGADRNVIITLQNSFHGRTVTTLSATGQDVFHNYFFPFTEGFKYAEPNNLDDFKNHIDESVCAVMLEVVQGEGGVNILDKDYVQTVAALCEKNDILLIVDEVQTGVGRTGKLFAHEHYGIKPDLMTVAKGLGGGLPIGVCLCGDKLKDVMSPSTHGTTFGANPVVCAGANYVLSRVANETFLDEVEAKGAYLEKKLLALDGVKSVNRLGLMVGIEIDGDAHDIAAKCVANGLLIITAKDLLRMLPPLIITTDELDEAVSILEKTLKEN
ncbi:MAG: aspartate aminotransferase family protein [Ruminococcus sp.]|nr:aspartate aminotransferase family protein [Ruminococcus sp.]